jgi:hypothetical protein
MPFSNARINGACRRWDIHACAGMRAYLAKILRATARVGGISKDLAQWWAREVDGLPCRGATCCMQNKNVSVSMTAPSVKCHEARTVGLLGLDCGCKANGMSRQPALPHRHCIMLAFVHKHEGQVRLFAPSAVGASYVDHGPTPVDWKRTTPGQHTAVQFQRTTHQQTTTHTSSPPRRTRCST